MYIKTSNVITSAYIIYIYIHVIYIYKYHKSLSSLLPISFRFRNLCLGHQGVDGRQTFHGSRCCRSNRTTVHADGHTFWCGTIRLGDGHLAGVHDINLILGLGL